MQNVRGHAADLRLTRGPRLRGKPASHESRQIAHAQIAAEEIRLPFAVRVAGDRGRAVKLPFIRFFAGIRGKHLHMRSGDAHVVLPQAGHGTVHRGRIPGGCQPNLARLVFRLGTENVEFLATNAQHRA